MNSCVRQAMILALVCFAFEWTRSSAHDAKHPTGLGVQELLEQSQPGPEYESLAKYAGSWKVSVTKGDGARAVSSSGRVNAHMMMDGRFLWIAYNVAGKGGAWKGASMIGFERRNSRYTVMGIDTHGTYSVSSQRTKDPNAKTIKLYGADDDPHMKAKGFAKEFAHVLDFRCPDEFAIDAFYADTRTPERREMKAMAFVFTRDR